VSSIPDRSKDGLRAGASTFEIKGSACPQLLAKLVGLLAQQDRIPDQVCASRDGDGLTITIRVSDIDDHRAGIIAEKMRGFVTVAQVALRFGES